ncbi:hypothetical protein BKA70DRAFT_1100903 [Coprinopsis sp. MPI-PUGE-AT-0042]|nr:hypothetical protein BKA70DRAFT_1100903 [Coprinopsis sp. MPI-PUGE-AT-0042]
MNSTLVSEVATSTLASIIQPSPSTLPSKPKDDGVPAHGASPVVAFLIGLSIILIASIMNAAGLNLTKYDHVRMSAIPKADRPKDWMRPIWLLGMLLYILSQLIGSTLALEYMRAEYVAPLGSSSLVFNFLFARFLVGTPVTKYDIWGTVVVVLGVIGIVAFGSINSGLSQETDATHLTALWRRGGWLSYFFAMGGALWLLVVLTSCLDSVLAARGETEARPATGQRPSFHSISAGGTRGRAGFFGKVVGFFKDMKANVDWAMSWITDLIEWWAGPKDDKQVAWTLGIGWACCGGGLAGGCLVFAKATVKLISGSLSRVNTGNQFGHASSIFTIIFLAVTAVMQILCLNRGLRVYESTLVVPVFYGVYTATGFLNSLIFNNEVEAYKSWDLFLIFLSIIVLIGGVVLLTHKKPEPETTRIRGAATPRTGLPGTSGRRERRKGTTPLAGDDEEAQLQTNGLDTPDGERWALGEISDSDEGDDPDVDHHLNPSNRSPLKRRSSNAATGQRPRSGTATSARGEHAKTDSERIGLMVVTDEDGGDDADMEDNSDNELASGKGKGKGKGKTKSGKVGRRRSMDPFRDETDEASELELFGMNQGRSRPPVR